MGTEEWTTVSLYVHVPVTVVWIALVAFEVFLCTVPALPGGQRMRPLMAMRCPTVALLVVMLITGVWQTMNNPFLLVDSWETLQELKNTTSFGMALFVKHIFVVGTVALSVAGRFVIAPRAVARGDDAPSIALRLIVWLNLAPRPGPASPTPPLRAPPPGRAPGRRWRPGAAHRPGCGW